MAYTPTEWQSGDIVTSEKLNKIENGIASTGGGGVMYVTISYDEVDGEPVYSADKTIDEIIAAVQSGHDVRATMAQGGGFHYLISCGDDSAGKCAEFHQITAYPNEDSPTTAHLASTDIYMSNEGSGDVVSVLRMEGDIALTIS